MTTSKLTKLAEEKSALELQMLSRQSMNWMKQKITNLTGMSRIPSQIAKETFRQSNTIKLGQLYYFYYDPKTKGDLPYYDRFPLVLMLERTPDGFMGLNLHYLPIKYRMAFLGKLMNYAVLNKDDEIQRLRVTYDILSASRRYREFRPCLKRYLLSHVQSKILAVQPDEWEIATYLPIHQFRKAAPQEIWQDSLDEMRKS